VDYVAGELKIVAIEAGLNWRCTIEVDGVQVNTSQLQERIARVVQG
jgi:hypothetical protein